MLCAGIRTGTLTNEKNKVKAFFRSVSKTVLLHKYPITLKTVPLSANIFLVSDFCFVPD
jgi:hypothetical protein